MEGGTNIYHITHPTKAQQFGVDYIRIKLYDVIRHILVPPGILLLW